jgi:hypothetical protein
MSPNLKKLLLVPITSLASFILPAPVNADGGDYLLPMAASVGEFNTVDEASPAGNGGNPCAEALKAAWFLHEIERSDGEVSPTAPNISECNRVIYAATDE